CAAASMITNRDPKLPAVDSAVQRTDLTALARRLNAAVPTLEIDRYARSVPLSIMALHKDVEATGQSAASLMRRHTTAQFAQILATPWDISCSCKQEGRQFSLHVCGDVDDVVVPSDASDIVDRRHPRVLCELRSRQCIGPILSDSEDQLVNRRHAHGPVRARHLVVAFNAKNWRSLDRQAVLSPEQDFVFKPLDIDLDHANPIQLAFLDK